MSSTAAVRREVDMVARARAGEESAWAELVEAHWRPVWSMSRSIVRDQHSAEEVTQETFRVVKEKLTEYRGDGALCGWIQSICRRQALDALRRRRRQGAREVSIDDGTGAGRPAQATEDRMVQRLDLERALALLAEEEREALLMTEAGYTSEELAAALGVAPTTIRSRRARARVRLLRELEGGYGGRGR
ncbi:MAG TPA: sigma-70 family RNA polymerase sigma factor [Candidatus Dormibacteraeota bacterium]|nr:sigma-70 family RNA polymerase sigma factor [Candidatus Dormibacteraeota bacterium]